MKGAYCSERYFEQLLFYKSSIFFLNVCRFRDNRGQRFAVLAPYILDYVTFDLNYQKISTF